MRKVHQNSRRGFTLAELMMAVGSGSIVLAALLASGVVLQRSFAAVEGYAIAEGDQLRVQDYIAMDCRRGTKIVVETGSWVLSSGTYKWVFDATKPQTLVVSLPGYYDGNKVPVAPFFDGTGKLQYNAALTWQQILSDGTTTVTNSGVPISYYQSGNNFIRQVGNDPTAAKPFGKAAIATNVSTFTVTPLSQSATNGTVSCAITFSPGFTRLPGSAQIAGTTVYTSTFLHNAQARQ